MSDEKCENHSTVVIQALPAPTSHPTRRQGFNPIEGTKKIQRKITTKHGWIGDYDYSWLCIPTIPFLSKDRRRPPPFYGVDDELPLLLAIIAGFQHCLAMLAGLITPPIIVGNALNLDASTKVGRILPFF